MAAQSVVVVLLPGCHSMLAAAPGGPLLVVLPGVQSWMLPASSTQPGFRPCIHQSIRIALFEPYVKLGSDASPLLLHALLMLQEWESCGLPSTCPTSHTPGHTQMPLRMLPFLPSPTAQKQHLQQPQMLLQLQTCRILSSCPLQETAPPGWPTVVP
jgi:hypothetical protein